MIDQFKKLFFLLIIISFIFPLAGQAQNQIALEISPLKTFVSIEPGQSQQSELFVKNLSTITLKIKPRVVEFTTIDDQGTLQINEGDFSEYINLPVSVFELKPGQKRLINFDAFAPAAESGGKYFAILFATEPLKRDEGAQFSGEVGSLVFMEIMGEINHEIQIKDFNTENIHWNDPEFTLSLVNTGNTHGAPFGEVKILNWRGNEKEIIPVFFPQILPGKERSQVFAASQGLFGKYSANLNLVDGDWNYISQDITFWVLPPINIFLIIIFLLIIVIVFIFFRKKKHV